MTQGQVDPRLLNGLEWRCIGPPRGGRVVAVAGDPANPAVFYFGAVAGGVWKTYDGGSYWENVSDGYFKTSSVGAIAVSDSDPNVVYAGMGESCIRVVPSYGDGVYRSTDAGKTWKHMGLEDTRHIGRVRIHPNNPDIVYVAALGHAFGPNEQRGVFRSTDGGETWEQVLFKSEDAGAVDLSMDPANPRILYASVWQVRRNFWTINSGGPDCGLYKSTDGGDTWTEISDNPGLPSGVKGRIGVAVSPAKPGRVYATIESEECGIYRSEDAGATWQLVNTAQDLHGRPWYYSHIFADPMDSETVWVLNFKCWKSTDGGKTFSEVTTPHGDNHDLWIDPRNTQRMIEGNDGGATVTLNGGDSWSTLYNQLTSQFYHVATDNRFPYRAYATQQDNSTISVPSRTGKGGIPWTVCYPVGSAESGHIAVHPDNSDVVFSGAIGSVPGGGGCLIRYDRATDQLRIVTVWPERTYGYGAKDHKYRFQWTFPIQFSPHDSNVLYVAGNILFRSTDEGSSWEPFSPDLTRNDVTKMEVAGGPFSKETTGAETYGTIFAFVESPHEKGVFWAGSDDGLVHISRDAGESWEQITPEGLLPWTLVSTIEASPHHPGTAYMAATRYKLDDNRPILYKTNDYGQNWTDISGGIPEHDYTRVIREDPARRGLLYVGTETGVYVSFDDGGSWQPLQVNLPVTPVHDLVIKDNDLVAATHGRSFWILDDLTQLHQMADDLAEMPFHLMKPRAAYRLNPLPRPRTPAPGKTYDGNAGVTYVETPGPTGEPTRKLLDAGTDAPNGVIVAYWLKDKPEGKTTLSFMDSQGGLIRNIGSKTAPDAGQSESDEADVWIAAEAGMNRFIWDMRYAPASRVPDDKSIAGAVAGPLALPGTYQVSITVGDESQTQSFEILKDPRVQTSQQDLEAQFDLLIRLRDRISETHDSVNRIRNIRRQVDEWTKRVEGHSSGEVVSVSAEALKEKLLSIESELIQVDYTGMRDINNLPTKLNLRLAELFGVVAAADFAPPRQTFEVFDDFNGRLEPQFQRLQEVVDEDVPKFENLVHELEIPAIVP